MVGWFTSWSLVILMHGEGVMGGLGGSLVILMHGAAHPHATSVAVYPALLFSSPYKTFSMSAV